MSSAYLDGLYSALALMHEAETLDDAVEMLQLLIDHAEASEGQEEGW